MTEAEEEYSQDISHRIYVADKAACARLNRKARVFKHTSASSDVERARLLKIEAISLIYQALRVRGVGVSNGVDETFNKLANSLIDSYDPRTGVPFSAYFVMIYYMRKKDTLNETDACSIKALRDTPRDENGLMLDDIYSIEDRTSLSSDELSENERFDIDLVYDVGLRENFVDEDNAAIEAAFLQILSLIVGFLEHAPDKRSYTSDRRLYTRLFFTESMTRAVKTRSSYEECVPFEKHEREVFDAVELPFQDSYLVDACRTIAALWASELKDGYGKVGFKDYKWQLPNDAFRSYMKTKKNKIVGGSTISNQRNNYEDLFGHIGDCYLENVLKRKERRAQRRK